MNACYPNNNFIFLQDMLHPIAQGFPRTFYEKNWGPDVLLIRNGHPLFLLLFFRWLLLEWDKKKVNSGHDCKRFESENELRDKICSVWDQCELLHKTIMPFLSSLRAVVTKERRSMSLFSLYPFWRQMIMKSEKFVFFVFFYLQRSLLVIWLKLQFFL